MLAKLITYGKDREAAIQRMIEAIQMYEIEGVATTLPFGKFVCEQEAFRSGHFDTSFVSKYYSPELLLKDAAAEMEVAAVLAMHAHLKNKKQLRTVGETDSNWAKR
jgi:propionyl-CoA carboxylase alpha chain